MNTYFVTSLTFLLWNIHPSVCFVSLQFCSSAGICRRAAAGWSRVHLFSQEPWRQSFPAAYFQFPGLWDCETGSSPRPLPPRRFLHGLQHRARLLWWRLNNAEQLQMFVVLISIHTLHSFMILTGNEYIIQIQCAWGFLSVCFTCHVLCFNYICTRVRC